MEYVEGVRLINVIDKEFYGEDTVNHSEMEITYNDDGRLVQSVFTDFTLESEVLTTITYTNALITAINVNDTTHNFEYEDGKLTTITSILDSEEDVQNFTYDKTGKLTQVTGNSAFGFADRTCYFEPPEEDAATPVFILQYDENGALKSIKGDQDNYLQTFEYFEDGLVKLIDTRYDCISDPNRIEVTYMENGKINTLFTTSEGYSTQAKREYDANGLLVAEIRENAFIDGLAFAEEVSFGYDENQVLVSMSFKNIDFTRNVQFTYERGICANTSSPNPIANLLNSISANIVDYDPRQDCGIPRQY